MIIRNDASSHISLVLVDGRSATARQAEVAAPLVFSEYYDTFLPLLVEKRIIIKKITGQNQPVIFVLWGG
ncbi:hypothetical protein J2X69_000157 [Algoriphagus sp. 4150]|uniref:hypothetical protein n=1 Tax=Algoriphagus sp. 4150 TaxID=2817756 RepID=UPI00285A3EE1|nr:hypothetical protein [Algoriphagus sp. 4150]MDR7127829.1 hypothetical protein [Algoriphagus sp. 4150]